MMLSPRHKLESYLADLDSTDAAQGQPVVTCVVRKYKAVQCMLSSCGLHNAVCPCSVCSSAMQRMLPVCMVYASRSSTMLAVVRY